MIAAITKLVPRHRLLLAVLLAGVPLLMPNTAFASCAAPPDCLCQDEDTYGSSWQSAGIGEIVSESVGELTIRLDAVQVRTGSEPTLLQADDTVVANHRESSQYERLELGDSVLVGLRAQGHESDEVTPTVLHRLDRRGRVRCQTDGRFRMEAGQALTALLSDECKRIRREGGYEMRWECNDVVILHPVVLIGLLFGLFIRVAGWIAIGSIVLPIVAFFAWRRRTRRT